jgi:TPR repeat protein
MRGLAMTKIREGLSGDGVEGSLSFPSRSSQQSTPTTAFPHSVKVTSGAKGSQQPLGTEAQGITKAVSDDFSNPDFSEKIKCLKNKCIAVSGEVKTCADNFQQIKNLERKLAKDKKKIEQQYEELNKAKKRRDNNKKLKREEEFRAEVNDSEKILTDLRNDFNREVEELAKKLKVFNTDYQNVSNSRQFLASIGNANEVWKKCPKEHEKEKKLALREEQKISKQKISEHDIAMARLRSWELKAKSLNLPYALEGILSRTFLSDKINFIRDFLNSGLFARSESKKGQKKEFDELLSKVIERMSYGLDKIISRANADNKTNDLGNCTDLMLKFASIFEEGQVVKEDNKQAFAWYKKAADLGNTEALYHLGIMYMNGRGVEKSHEQALESFEKAANGQPPNTRAMYHVGRMLEERENSTPEDLTQAEEWYKKAAANGDTVAMNNLAMMYLKGQVKTKDPEKTAIELLQKAAAGHTPKEGETLKIGQEPNVRAMINLGDIYMKKYKPYSEHPYWFEDSKREELRECLNNAQNYYEQAAKLGNTEAIVKLGQAFYSTNKDTANEWLQKAVDVGDLTAMHQLGKNYAYSDDKGIQKKGVELLQKAIKLGSFDAMNTLGAMYKKGIGIDRDPKQAFKLYLKAANLGHAEAMRNAGECYAEGFGVTLNKNSAIMWYKKAADAGDAEAMVDIGQMLEEKNGTGNEVALLWYSQAAKMGNSQAAERLKELANGKNSDAMFYYGFVLEHGYGVKQNLTEAAKSYNIALNFRDYPEAMRSLGLMYEEGKGVEKNLESAKDWYEKAAGAGNADAMLDLGHICKEGKGVEKNLESAKYWYGKAADAGNADAMVDLGHIYEEEGNLDLAVEKYGDAAEKGSSQAVECLKKLAEKAYLTAMYEYGFALEHGNGVRPDLNKAAKLYKDAALKGYQYAVQRLKELAEKDNRYASMYATVLEAGPEGIKNLDQAVEWYTKAANQNDDVDAMRKLGEIFKSNVEKQDNEKAYFWYNRAAKKTDLSSLYEAGRMLIYGNGCKGNSKEGKKLIEKAAILGDKEAQEFLNNASVFSW